MNLLRSLVFTALVAAITVVFGILLVVGILLPLRVRFAILVVWRRLYMAFVRGLLGIRHDIEGAEHIPPEAVIILSKHQSAWETVALQEIFNRPLIFVLKKELLRMPFFGWGLAALQMVSIDRAAGKDALMQVARQGRDRIARGYSVVVFPEGTRVAPGVHRRYKPGGAHLAVNTGARVVPVAHTAGEFWPRNALVKRPGVIRVSIGAPIDPTGLSVEEVNRRVETWIEGEMRRLAPHRYPAA